MKLQVEVPPAYLLERKYILSVMLEDFLGLDITVKPTSRSNTRLSLAERDLILEDGLLATSDAQWLTPTSLPSQPLEVWDGSDLVDDLQNVPVLYGKRLPNGTFADIKPDRIHLGLDIFGAAFFMLTRYEEVAKPERDEHDRFPATASLAYQENFLQRPVVNEYLELLWACMKLLWPGLERTPRAYRLQVSHDVDAPLLSLPRTAKRAARSLGGDLLKRRNAKLALGRTLSYLGSHHYDPANTFDLLMSTSEEAGIKSAFYFITDHSAGEIDGHYSLEMPFVQDLLKEIHERGHEIGLHPSYNTFDDSEQTRLEFEKLQAALSDLGISQATFGGRQHYLRWQAPTTWQTWADAGLDYDSTVGYADQVGFRAGTCYAYPVFNLRTRQALKLIERPLLVMDCSLFDRRYMGLSPAEGLDTVRDLHRHCLRHQGDFTLLWHNSYFDTAWQARVYKNLIALLAS